MTPFCERPSCLLLQTFAKLSLWKLKSQTTLRGQVSYMLHDKYPTCTLLILYDPPLVSPPTSGPEKFGGPKVMSGFGLDEIKGSEVDVLVTFNCLGCLRSQDHQAGPSMDPKLITTHDTGEVGFLDNIFYPNSDKGRLGSMKRFSSGSGPDMAPKWPNKIKVANLIPSILRLMMCPRVPKVTKINH